MRELQHVAATRLGSQIYTTRLSNLLCERFGVNVAFLLFTNTSSRLPSTLGVRELRLTSPSLARRPNKDRGGETPVESKPSEDQIVGDVGHSSIRQSLRLVLG